MAYSGGEFLLAHHPCRPNALVHAAAGFGSLNRCLDKITLHHRKSGSDDTFLDAILRAVENNGQVTLPASNFHPHRWKIVTGIVLGVAGAGALAVALLR